jgi:predicted Fe-Mo cluster-binding NifX family protein
MIREGSYHHQLYLLKKVKIMKVAVPTKGNVVDDHFGHCRHYTIFTINASQEIVDIEVLPSPNGCGCKSNISAVLKEKGVTAMLAGNMGDGALQILSHHGIEVIRGCSGNVQQLAEMFIKGTLEDSGKGCSRHEQHGKAHVCDH